MSNPVPTYTFEVIGYSLSNTLSASLPDSRENILFGLQQRAVCLETVSSPVKYGDRITVSGQQAYYLKKLYVDVSEPILKIICADCGDGEACVDGSCVRAIPTVVTADLEMGFAMNATVTADILDRGLSEITEYGFVWAEHDSPTLDDNVVIVGTDDLVDDFDENIGSLPWPATIYFAAYATNSYGTAYGEVLNGETDLCLAAGTKITLANGSNKNIEDVTYEDDLLVWDFDRRQYSSSKPVWIMKPVVSRHYGIIQFSNGTKLKTVVDGRGHRIFNMDKGMFTYSMNQDTPLKTKTITDQQELVSVVDKELVKEETVFYNIITDKHFNMFANGILTSTGLNNLYPIEDMRFVKSSKQVVDVTEFSEIPSEIVSGLRLSEQSVDYPRLSKKLDMMLSKMVDRT